MIMKRALLCLGVLAGVAGSAGALHAEMAQPPTQGKSKLSATGKVVDPAGQPQKGVPVKIEGPLGKTFVFTDSKGVWSLYNLPSGDYRIQMVGPKATDDASLAFTVKEKTWMEILRQQPPKKSVLPNVELGRTTKQAVAE